MRKSSVFALILLTSLLAKAADPLTGWRVLSAGAVGGEPVEEWHVGHDHVLRLPSFDPARGRAPLEPEAAARRAQSHLKQRFPARRFVFTEANLIHFIPVDQVQDNTRNRDWVYLVEFREEQASGYEIVPVLLDGTVILSSNEE